MKKKKSKGLGSEKGSKLPKGARPLIKKQTEQQRGWSIPPNFGLTYKKLRNGQMTP